VKKNLWITLIVGIALGLGIYTIPAITQQPPPASQEQPPYRIAVVDLAQILEAHPEFKTKRDNLKRTMDTADAKFTEKQEVIAARAKKLEASQLKPGTDPYLQEYDAIVREQAALDIERKNFVRQLSMDNSKMMYDTYQHIRTTISKIAMPHGIAQVTDYRELDINPIDAPMVSEDMDQRLVWYHPRVNITQAVIDQMYRDYGVTDKDKIPTAVIRSTVR
jgi:Skp family chaperone for outer membrane proteins